MGEITVPFLDLHAQYCSIKEDIDQAVQDVIARSAFIQGPYVTKFEEEFSKVLGVRRCVSCGNGTDALYIAMKSLGVGPGDEIIVPANSWISTSETVTQAGGKVVFVDVNSDDYLIDVSKIQSKITSNTVGIVPVHLYGQAAEMDKICEIAENHGLWIIEDCAQAHLAKYKGKLVGSFGNAATFSFFPGKNLGAMGDAGAIITNDDLLADNMTMYARHGGLKKGDHFIEGVNSRMDGIQAAILSVKLKHLQSWTNARQKISHKYNKFLQTEVPTITTPIQKPECEHVWHLYVIRSEKRDALNSFLNKNGISTNINYKKALPFTPAYSYLNKTQKDFPISHFLQSRILSIPIFPELSHIQIEKILSTLKKFESINGLQ